MVWPHKQHDFFCLDQNFRSSWKVLAGSISKRFLVSDVKLFPREKLDDVYR